MLYFFKLSLGLSLLLLLLLVLRPFTTWAADSDASDLMISHAPSWPKYSIQQQ